MSYINFNPDNNATKAFNNMFGSHNEVSPLGSAGNSHFGYVSPYAPGSNDTKGWHNTTQVGGLKVGGSLSFHTQINNYGSVVRTDISFKY